MVPALRRSPMNSAGRATRLPISFADRTGGESVFERGDSRSRKLDDSLASFRT